LLAIDVTPQIGASFLVFGEVFVVQCLRDSVASAAGQKRFWRGRESFVEPAGAAELMDIF
jgi:hypothetical protein